MPCRYDAATIKTRNLNVVRMYKYVYRSAQQSYSSPAAMSEWVKKSPREKIRAISRLIFAYWMWQFPCNMLFSPQPSSNLLLTAARRIHAAATGSLDKSCRWGHQEASSSVNNRFFFVSRELDDMQKIISRYVDYDVIEKLLRGRFSIWYKRKCKTVIRGIGKRSSSREKKICQLIDRFKKVSLSEKKSFDNETRYLRNRLIPMKKYDEDLVQIFLKKFAKVLFTLKHLKIYRKFDSSESKKIQAFKIFHPNLTKL